MRTSIETGRSIEVIVEAMNSIELGEIDAILKSLSRDEAIGPLVDPTLWGHGGMFDVARQTRKVLNAIRAFKIEVSGIGNFSTMKKEDD